MNVIEQKVPQLEASKLVPGTVFRFDDIYYVAVNKTVAPFKDNPVYGVSFEGSPFIVEPDVKVEIVNGSFVVGLDPPGGV